MKFRRFLFFTKENQVYSLPVIELGAFFFHFCSLSLSLGRTGEDAAYPDRESKILGTDGSIGKFDCSIGAIFIF